MEVGSFGDENAWLPQRRRRYFDYANFGFVRVPGETVVAVKQFDVKRDVELLLLLIDGVDVHGLEVNSNRQWLAVFSRREVFVEGFWIEEAFHQSVC